MLYLQSLITIEQAYNMQKEGYSLIPCKDKCGNPSVFVSKED